MDWFMPLLLAVSLTPLGGSTKQDQMPLLAHQERKSSAYLVLRLITQEIEVIPAESLDQCEVIGAEIMKGGKLSKFLKGYQCIPGLTSNTLRLKKPLRSLIDEKAFNWLASA